MTELTYDDLIAAGHFFLDALAARDPSRLNLAQECRATENCAGLAIGEGLWRSVTAVTYRQLFADLDAGQVGIFAVVEESGVPAVFAARLRLVAGALTEVETLVSRDGDSSIFNPASLVIPNPLFADVNDPAARPTREQLVAVADGYFQALQDDSTATVNFHPDCQRIENGFQTTSTPRTGNLGAAAQIDSKMFVYIRDVRERRFPLVDVERGLVLAMGFLDVPGDIASVEVDGNVRKLPAFMRTPRSTLLFELFKVIPGPQVRWIEAMMINRPLGTKSGWA